MFIACAPLLLASASPRRKEYLSRLGLKFRVIPASIDETPEIGESSRRFARRMAATKAGQVADVHPEACVIGADTVVALGQTIFGKPRDQQEALATLKTLQGRTHEVTTGFAITSRMRKIEEVDSVTTLVTFGIFSDRILQAYVDSGEPLDKAGAYGIQGKGSFLVQSVAGSCSNVVGLPVYALIQSLLSHSLLKTS